MTGFQIQAQTVYGVGPQGSNNRLFSVNPATGAATNLCALGTPSAANGVSPLNGLVYYIEGGTGARPDMRVINPLTCGDSLVATSNLIGSIIRMTFCPDGRLYAASSTGTNNNNNTYIWEVNPTTAQTVRRITLTGVRTGGSGDMACVNNGDLYVLANTTSSGPTYRLYRADGTALRTAANNTAITPVALTNNIALTGVPNGLTEVSTAVTGCNAVIATYPCLIASTGTTNRTWSLNTANGSATNLGATGFTINDLSRSFPVDAVATKDRTSATTIQQGNNRTISYVITVTNAGPGLIAGGATVTDTLDPTVFNVAMARWTCSVTTAGSATAVTTACGAASGTGNINQTVTLSVNGVLTYNMQAPVLNTFNGSAGNVASINLPANITDTAPANNTGTAPDTTVTAVTTLTISKTNNTNAVIAGQTTSYTITVANTGLADADDSAVRDADINGLTCSQIVCVSAVGNGATCPPPANVTVPNLQNMAPSGGIRLPNFPAGSTVTFALNCGVDATGS